MNVSNIKKFLDSIKTLEHLLSMIIATGKEEVKDELFYSTFMPLYEEVASLDGVYDKVRNYLTKKTYSKEKIKL